MTGWETQDRRRRWESCATGPEKPSFRRPLARGWPTARTLFLEQPRLQHGGEEGAEVDDPVEGVEDDLGERLRSRVELIADEARDQRLDAARAERDQAEPDAEPGEVVDEQREARLTRAVDQAEPEDRVELAEEAIGQPAAEQREKVNADDEGVKNILRGSGAISLW